MAKEIRDLEDVRSSAEDAAVRTFAKATITTTDMTTIMATITTTTMTTTMTTIMTTDTTTDMITTTDTTMDMTMGTTMITIMEAAAATIAQPTTTASTNWCTTTRPIPTQCTWPVIRTTASAPPAIPMKSIAISAAKAWHTANAVCRTPTM